MKIKTILFLINLLPAIVNAQWTLQMNKTTYAAYFLKSTIGWCAHYKDSYHSDLYKTVDSGKNWSLLVSMGSISKIQFIDENVGYIQISNASKPNDFKQYIQIKKTSDGGITWAVVFETAQSGNSDMQFINENVGWLYNTFLYKTTDGGVSWKSIFENDGNLREIYFKDENTGWLFGNTNYNTLDGGLTWESNPNYNFNSIDFISATVGFASLGWKQMKTIDGGKNWFIVANFEGTTYWSAKKLKFINNMSGFSLDDGSPSSLWATGNGGKTWEKVSILGVNNYNNFFITDIENIWLNGYSGVYKRGITPYLGLTFPVGSEKIPNNYPLNITWWQLNLDGSAVILDYSTDNGNNWNTIDTVSTATLKYTWNVPPTINSDKCLIRVKELTGKISVQSDLTFSIQKETRQLTNIKVIPIQKSRINPNSPMKISWESNYISSSRLKLSTIPTDHNYEQISNVYIKDNTAIINSPYWENTFQLKIEDADNPQISCISEPFIVKNDPAISLLTNVATSPWFVGDTREVKLDLRYIFRFRIEFTNDDGNTWVVVENEIIADSSKTSYPLKYNWKIPYSLSKECRLKFTNLDDKNIYSISPQFEVSAEKIMGSFPLAIGNKWFYDYKHYISYPPASSTTFKMQSIWEVADTVLMNDGVKYFLVKMFDKQNDSYRLKDTCYISCIKNNVNIIGPFDPKTFSMSFANFDKFNLFDYNKIMNKELQRFCVYDDLFPNHFHWVTNGLGVSNYNCVSLTGGGYGMYLAGCILNGEKYGEILENYIVGFEEEKKTVPASYSLSQNYPNPFNPETTINYQLSTPGFVTLKVYDLLGREVATLVDEYKQAGAYNSKFNAQNFQLPSGVYFYRLQAGGFSETKKFVLMK